MNGPPPRPITNRRPEPALTRARPRLDSHDNASAVRAEEAANVREGQLLAQLATEQQKRVAEEQRRTAAETLASKLQAEAEAAAQARARPPVVVNNAPVLQSVPPPGEAFRARDVRIGDLKGWAALLAGVTALVIGVLGYVKPEPPPRVIDNAATVSVLQAELSRQARELSALRKAQAASEGWTGAVFEAIGADIRRADGAPAMPSLDKTPLTLKPIKPLVRIDTPQPTTPTESTQ